MDIMGLLLQLLSLAGFGALVAVIVNILKYFNVVQEGTAPTWSVGLNIVGLIVLFVLKVFLPQQDIGALDGIAASIAQLLVVVLGLLTQLGFSKIMHISVKGTPVVGQSDSLGMKRVNAPKPA
jgi:hypothetical protein